MRPDQASKKSLDLSKNLKNSSNTGFKKNQILRPVSIAIYFLRKTKEF